MRLVLAAFGLLLHAGCGIDRIYGPLEIEVRPLNLAIVVPIPISLNISHTANYSNYEKLIDECGPGMEKIEEMYEHRIADMTDPDEIRWAYNETVEPVIQESMARCLRERPALVPKECKRRMITVSSGRGRGGDGGVGLECGESFVLPLEVKMEELDEADPRRQPWRGSEYGMRRANIKPPRGEATHVGHYSDLRKLLDECGPGAERTQGIVDQIHVHELHDVLGRIVDDALIECLKKRNLVPPECRNGMVPVHNPVMRSFFPQVGFRCGGSAG